MVEENENAEARLTKCYKLGKVIGQGANATVHKATDIKTGETVAIKRMTKKNMEPDDITGMQTEI